MAKKNYVRNVLILFLACFSVLLSGPQKCGPIDPGTLELVKAVNDLDSNDYVVVRAAIVTIEKNISNPNILSIVKPLSEVAINKNGRRDAYTRMLSVPVLFRIGINHPKTGQGRKAIHAVVDLLHNSPADMVRGTCANTIGTNGYTDAISDLEEALNDPSAYVQQESCLAMLHLTKWTYHSEQCNPLPDSTAQVSTLTPDETKSITQAVGLLSSEDAQNPLYDWIKSHTLIPLPISNPSQNE